MSGPIEQFDIKSLIDLKIGDVDVSFTNASLFMVIAFVLASAFFILAMRRKALIPGKWQSLAESIYEFIDGMVKDNVGPEGKAFIPFVFSVFIFITFGNVLGVLPYSFTYTSQVPIVAGIAVLGFLVNTAVGIKKKKWGFLHTFFPAGIPIAAAPIVIPIEIVSYLSKPFSLTVRLVANMTVGHIMLKVVAGFIVSLGLLGLIPFAFTSILVIFEAGIAVLQAYVFTMLTCIYLGDAVHEH